MVTDEPPLSGLELQRILQVLSWDTCVIGSDPLGLQMLAVLAVARYLGYPVEDRFAIRRALLHFRGSGYSSQNLLMDEGGRI